eukprot:146407_1
MHRAAQIVGHLDKPSQGTLSANNVAAKKDDDIVIIAPYRTALCRAKRGGFRDSTVTQMLAPVLKRILDETRIDPKSVGDIVVGTVQAPGSLRQIECRQAQFIAGFPETTTLRTVNRQCSSGLQAVADVAAAIRAGYYDIGVAAGAESMSLDQRWQWYVPILDEVTRNKNARNCMTPMGITSENVAAKFGISRQEQDAIGLRSHQRAFAARERFRAEIVPVVTIQKDPKTGVERRVTVERDDGVRPDASAASMAKLRPAFKKGGTTTAANSSQVSDGAAAMLMMKRSTARRLGLEVMGSLKSFAVVGCPPEIMGIGPALAIPEAVKRAGLSIGDVDLFEINEAFASQAGYCVKKLGLSWDKVNVNGGAIALGHPLGCTGARAVATLLHEMKRRRQKYGVVSMCIGSGQGAAAVFERD